MRLRWVSESAVDPARALATGAALRAMASDGADAPAILYGAALGSGALVLGRWQRLASSVDAEGARERGLRLLRRRTGGPASLAGEGILYFALGLRHASALVECPPDRVLNRYVRGFLGGLAKSGAQAHYFGRQWLSVSRRPCALVGWTRDEAGRVLVEVFLSGTSSFAPSPALLATPPTSEPPFLGKEPITLEEALGAAPQAESIVRRVAEGHRARLGGSIVPEQSSFSDEERELIASLVASTDPGGEEAPDDLRWSEPAEVPIGFVSAGVRRSPDGAIESVRVAGDFFQDETAPAYLQERLAGRAADRATLAAAVNATWDGKTRVVEGLRRLETLLTCLSEAAG